MTLTQQLLAAVKRKQGIKSDYGLHKFFQVSKQQISAYMGGVSMGDDMAVRVADVLDLDRAAVLAAMAAERAKSDDARKAWRDAVRRLGGIAAGVAVLFLGTPPPPAGGACCGAGALSVYYVKRRRPRHGAPDVLAPLFTAVRAAWATVAGRPWQFA